MTHSYGYKRRTRHKFRKGFRAHGAIHISKTLTTYKIGDIVDIVVDGAIHKGMPYKYYHGRTGRVFNVNPRAIGVIVNKQVRNRIIPKRIHVRIEHLKLSTSRTGFLDRIRENDKKKTEANKQGQRISTKRVVAQPTGEINIAKPDIQLLNPKLFLEIV
jgi:large subunit ribosomal protein L21e